MSRTHLYRKSYNAGTVGNTTAFVFSILLISNAWIHKASTMIRKHILATSIYGEVAKELAESNNCILVGRNVLMKWIREKKPER